MAIKASTRRIAGFVKEVEEAFLEGLQEQKPIVRAGELARRLMTRRTRAGIDRHGRIFRYYRPSTRQRKGRKSPVTLMDSEGTPLPGRSVVKDEGYWGRGRRVDIRPRDAETKRLWRWHIRGTSRADQYGLDERDFLGLTPQEEEAVARQEIRPALSRAIPKDRRRRVRLTLIDA